MFKFSFNNFKSNCNMTGVDSVLNNFPFKARLNLSRLIDYWEANLDGNGVLEGTPAEAIKAKIDAAPELRKPLNDISVVDKHKGLVGLLMSAIFPPAFADTDIAAALAPFYFTGFYATPSYRKLMPFGRVRDDIQINLPDGNLINEKIIHACIYVLNKFYGTHIDMDRPILVSMPDLETGLTRTYKANINLQFVDVYLIAPELPPISDKQIKQLLNNIDDVDLWMKYISPEAFGFEGFSILRLTDVTVEEMLSSIKYDLLKKHAVTREDSFNSIQDKMRSIFQLPQMRLGLSYFDPYNKVISNHGAGDWSSFVLPTDPDMNNISCESFQGSVYDKAYCEKRTVIIEDINDYEFKTDVERGLLSKGIRNIAIAPLVYEEEVIGILELGNPGPGKINAINAAILSSVLPMFTASVSRVLSDMQTEVRALIQKECTAIHPSVEWRFLEEGYKIIDAKKDRFKMELPGIGFNDVYPLYGMSDIRNSSSKRNDAIQSDLLKNLREIRSTIGRIQQLKNMPILDEINHRAGQEIERINDGLSSGDESAIISFIKNEIGPAFYHFKNYEAELREIIEDYEKLLDKKLGVIYDKRKDFETSLTKINEVVSGYLDQVEVTAQSIFPHYFEKYKTDGVEYNIYIGQSLVKDRQFDLIYLKNLRLWQLITMCEIATKVEALREELDKDLEIAQLILVHADPISIKFRKDEKRFDVDGAYNIRYEIIKKRIDKAYIRNTKERLTQPGKISIVYSQQSDMDEYHKYIGYLQSINYLNGEVERFELEELQGAQGLKAIRVTVNTEKKAQDFGSEVLTEITAAIGA